jgi:hypothetical protein
MARARSPFGLAFALCATPFACAVLIVDDGDDDSPPPDPTWVACAVNSECTLIANGCCGACVEPGLDDVTAVNRQHADDYRYRLCPRPVACSACPTEQAPNLLASCLVGRCFELDVRAHPASACERDEDCRPRTSGCCECGGPTVPHDLVAIGVANEPLYRGLVCDSQQACPECRPSYPGDVEAYCGGDRHCALRRAPAATAPPTDGR